MKTEWRCMLTFVILSLLQITSSNIAAHLIFQTSLSLTILCDEPTFLFGFFIHRIRCFFVKRSSEERCPAGNNTPAVPNLTQLSRARARETITISSVSSLESQIVTIDSDSNEPTILYGFGSQDSIATLSLNDLNLPPNPFNVLATMPVIRADEEYSPQSAEPSIPCPISTPPINVSTIKGCETTHTTTNDATFYSDDEFRRVFWDTPSSETFDSNEPRHVSIASSPSSTSPPPRQQKIKVSTGMSFPKKAEASQHTCEAFGQPLPGIKETWCSGKSQTLHTFNQTLTIIITCIFNCCAYIRISI